MATASTKKRRTVVIAMDDIPFAIDVNAVRAAYANHKIETENKLYDLALLMKAYCKRTITGSVSGYVLHHSSVPVLICPPKHRPK
uniref:Uncharacterized protein n=1 Tax=Magallana gigas TaxID=29159 RepID=K1R437_MAGGI